MTPVMALLSIKTPDMASFEVMTSVMASPEEYNRSSFLASPECDMIPGYDSSHGLI
jgi:hypothetical protein